MDDVRIYNYTLSAQEVANLYNAAKVNYVSGGDRTGLVGWWTLDRTDIYYAGTATTTYDRSGKNNTGTLVIGADATSGALTTGKIKQAIDFDGTNDYIDLFTNSPSTSTLSPQQLTISAWVRLDAVGGGSWSWIVSNASFSKNVTGGFGLLRNSANTYAFNVNIFSQQASTGVIAALDGRWHHLVGTFDGSTMIAYLDSVSGTPVSYVSAITYYADEIFNIGSSVVNTSYTYFWNGGIDDVRLYNRALSAKEVKNLYDAAKTNFN